jgi:hypothetical protein
MDDAKDRQGEGRGRGVIDSTELWRMYPDSMAVAIGEGRRYTSRWQSFVSAEIAAAINAGDARLMLHAAPQHGKSEVCEYDTATWFLEHYPQKRVILTCAVDVLATGFAGRVRNSFEHNPLLTTRLAQDSKAKDLWHTPQGGGMRAAGVGGSLYGFPADLILADD